MKKENVVSLVVGVAVLFGTVYLVSKAWKLGQKDKKAKTLNSPNESVTTVSEDVDIED